MAHLKRSLSEDPEDPEEITSVKRWQPSISISQERYRHSPLPNETSIRLLRLLPGERSSDIRCRLEFTDINNLPKFGGISYTWGDSADKGKIICDEGYLFVPSNLVDALRVLRKEKDSLLLWGDAACIDQSNASERGHQVNLMGKVFAGAERVHIWLGQSNGDAEEAFGCIHDILEIDESVPYGSRDTVEGSEAIEAFLDNIPDTRWNAFRRVTTRPWFTRIWVIQEVGLAPEATVMCGELEINWNLLVKASTFLRFWLLGERLDFLDGVGYIDDISRIYEGCPYETTFIYILDKAREQNSSDPRDKVFALLGHPSAKRKSGNGTIVQADYSKAAAKVYQELAVELMRDHGNLYPLSAVVHLSADLTEENATASWVPQWDLQHYLPYMLVRNRDKFRAAALTNPTFLFPSNSDILQVEGFIFDTVLYQAEEILTTDHIPKRSIPGSKGNYIRVLYDMALGWQDSSNSKKTANDSKRILPLTLAAEGFDLSIYMELDPDQRARLLLADFAEYWIESCTTNNERANGILNPAIDSLSINFEGLPPPSAYSYRAAAVRALKQRRLFYSKKGYFGLGPAVMQPGDIVCVLFGAQVPFILRRKDSRYQLVGESYVHGIMHGEAIKMLEDCELEKQTFSIC
jgi:Heterokaryon incompatibility protein (HET)